MNVLGYLHLINSVFTKMKINDVIFNMFYILTRYFYYMFSNILAHAKACL